MLRIIFLICCYNDLGGRNMKKIFTILLALIMSFTAMTALVKADEFDTPENGVDIHEYKVVDLQTIDKISYSTTFAIQGLSPMTFSYRIRTTGSILLLDQVPFLLDYLMK